jgi:hypothetical protein
MPVLLYISFRSGNYETHGEETFLKKMTSVYLKECRINKPEPLIHVLPLEMAVPTALRVRWPATLANNPILMSPHFTSAQSLRKFISVKLSYFFFTSNWKP